MSISNLQLGTVTPANCFSVVANWVEGLHGSGELSDVLANLTKIFKCEAAVVARYNCVDGKVRTISCSVSGDQKAFPPRNPRPLCHDMLGDILVAAKPGIVWTFSDVDDRQIWEHSEQLRNSMSHQSLRDVFVLSLDTRGDVSDCLELHFSNLVSESNRELIEVIADALSDSWGGRCTGLVTKILSRSRFTQVASRAGRIQQTILGIENPAGLSRSEYRICTLIKEGLAAKTIAEELSIRETTVRSHLHSIYAKTETSGQMELLHKLSKSLQQGYNKVVLLN